MTAKILKKIFNAVVLPAALMLGNLLPQTAAAQTPRIPADTIVHLFPTPPRIVLEQTTTCLLFNPLLDIKIKWQDLEARHKANLDIPFMADAYKDWLKDLDSLQCKTNLEKATAVHALINQLVAYKSDKDVYKQNEHWSTPMETLVGRRGDCEDYAILKYYSLRYLGVPAQQLHVLVVGDSGGVNYNHGVLGINVAKPGDKPDIWVLDQTYIAPVKAKDYPNKLYYVMNELEVREGQPADLLRYDPSKSVFPFPVHLRSAGQAGMKP